MPSKFFAATFLIPQIGSARLLNACAGARRLQSSTASRTLCFAPIRATRQPSEILRDSTSKFPFVDTFKLSSGELYRSAEVITGLAPLATSKRLATLAKVVDGRSFSILPIVEGLHDMGNLGAICRSADALGLGAVHCINAESQRYRARKQRNSAGAEKWMDIRMWDSPASCIQTAQAAGYHVVATHFDPDAVSIHDIDWTQPTAVILGNEREGDSQCKATHLCLRRNSYYANKLLVHSVLPVSGSAVVARLFARALSILYCQIRLDSGLVYLW
ncbi:TPA: hypothetical protein ACH3X1_010096 [Trebouxia sp. C0004]